MDVIDIDLNKILLEKIEEEVQEKRKEVVIISERLKSLLIRIAKARRWTITTNMMGTDIHHPEQERDLDLLEKCGLIKSKVRYTKHNSYREYSVTEKGQAMVRSTPKEI